MAATQALCDNLYFMESFIKLENVSFSRGDKVIFDDLSLEIPQHKITIFMGPSGTGKTTLLRLISGQLKPDSGKIWVAGEEVTQKSLKELYQMRRKMSMLFQAGALFTDLNVFDNIAFPIRAHTDLTEQMVRDLVLMKLEAVGLRGAAELTTAELSGGMSRRVALARAIALDPRLMMYDEPFTGQDPITRGVLIELIRKLNDSFGMTSLVVTHDINEARALGDEIVIFSQGKMVGQDTPQNLLQDADPAVHQFVHALPDGVVPYQYPAPPYREDLGCD